MRTIIALLLPLIAGCGVASVRAAETVQARVNFLLITVDDMNCDSIGAFGCPVPDVTPNIDRLASEGLRFEHAHVTIAICQPTRAVWMTGRYPHRNGAVGFDPIRRGVPTLVEQLKSAGYFNGLLAKSGHVVPTRYAAFDVIVHANELGVGRDPSKYYQHTKAFLEQAKETGRPFFLMANSQDPHRPFAGSDQEKQRKAAGQRSNKNKKRKKKRRRVSSNFPPASKHFDPNKVPLPGFLPDLPEVRLEMAEYFASVHRADEIVGAVLRALKETGFDASTMVMFLSDHGMPLPFAKTNCYYHSTRTPWIVRWPGKIKPGGVDRKHSIGGVDLMPTALDCLGVAPLGGVDGRSFKPLLLGESQQGRERVHTYINRTSGRNEYPMRAVTEQRFGYIYNGWSNGMTVFRNESQNGRTMRAMRQAATSNPNVAERVKLFLYRVPEELYDYQNDPDARHNLVGRPEHKQTLERLRLLLRENMQATEDPQLADYVRYLGSK